MFPNCVTSPRILIKYLIRRAYTLGQSTNTYNKTKTVWRACLSGEIREDNREKIHEEKQ
jgi:hypothetical protein